MSIVENNLLHTDVTNTFSSYTQSLVFSKLTEALNMKIGADNVFKKAIYALDDFQESIRDFK